MLFIPVAIPPKSIFLYSLIYISKWIFFGYPPAQVPDSDPPFCVHSGSVIQVPFLYLDPSGKFPVVWRLLDKIIFKKIDWIYECYIIKF